VVRGQLSLVRGQLSLVCVLWSVVGRQWSAVAGESAFSARGRFAHSRRRAIGCAQRIIAAGCLGLWVLVFTATAQSSLPQPGPLQSAPPQEGRPRILRDIGIEQRLNELAPLDLVFRDEQGRSVRLGEFFNGKPVILALVYYNCPMLCNQVLNGLASSLDVLKFDVGKEFNVVTVSFDPRDTPEIAAAKKEGYMARYKRAGAADGWHFLSGDSASIEQLTNSVGFKYEFDEKTNQFAHASGIMILTPQGKLARYFYGIEYAPKDLRLGLIEASENKIGTPVDALLLYCYHYDPTTGKYGPVVMNIMKLGGIVTIIGIVALLLLLRRKSATRMEVGVGGVA